MEQEVLLEKGPYTIWTMSGAVYHLSPDCKIKGGSCGLRDATFLGVLPNVYNHELRQYPLIPKRILSMHRMVMENHEEHNRRYYSTAIKTVVSSPCSQST